MLCPSCHTENRDNARFCKKCGLHFNDEQSAQTVPEQPAETARTTDAQPASSPVPPEPSAPQAGSTAAQGINGNNAVEDISQAPTQFLTPQRMIEYHKHRWEQEMQASKASAQMPAQDIAE